MKFWPGFFGGDDLLGAVKVHDRVEVAVGECSVRAARMLAGWCEVVGGLVCVCVEGGEQGAVFVVCGAVSCVSRVVFGWPVVVVCRSSSVV